MAGILAIVRSYVDVPFALKIMEFGRPNFLRMRRAFLGIPNTLPISFSNVFKVSGHVNPYGFGIGLVVVTGLAEIVFQIPSDDPGILAVTDNGIGKSVIRRLSKD